MDEARDQHDARIDLALRWRLVLGRHAEEPLELDPSEPGDGPESDGGAVDDPRGEARALDVSLDYIYDREFSQRAHQQGGGGGDGLSIPAWLGGVRELFPAEAIEVLERDALHRYGLTELVTDPEILARARPTQELVKAILQFRHKMPPDVLAIARGVVRQVVDALAETLTRDTHAALHGRASARERPPARTWRNLDYRRTIRRNLRNWDADRSRLVLHDVHFRHNAHTRGRWNVIIAVDQSGSMVDSLIHAAVTAAVFAGLPAVDVKLLLWDHRLVDMSAQAHDALEVLMGAQLGGGTELLPALQWCAAQVVEPERTLLVVISDWFVWSHKAECLTLAKDLHDDGIHCLGLCALNTDVRPVFDEVFARGLADAGWFVAASTPRELVGRIGRILR
ncbi:MAG: hypothetical protein ACI8PZ_001134 [Myxococcota bacterium]